MGGWRASRERAHEIVARPILSLESGRRVGSVTGTGGEAPRRMYPTQLTGIIRETPVGSETDLIAGWDSTRVRLGETTMDRELPEFLTRNRYGEIRLTGHRIGLLHLVDRYNQGLSPEAILCDYPSLSLA